eukprot:CAMPEP_0203904038 /NCGR_PEP_ID=MMETSP0359-20131031/45916_1 /ASSEMBLY_ACC=CAM_ASM_000338 /TAXON_ID=268821 /ORGANISM="Scrippsiella Hangoei, Strain SHTV-5" /LENGTH=450 /DNA_ID=CAMNT_0050828191 /DNA_START=36 /DNA_END=1388 /DNA_ORIENTATION=-
MSKLEITVVGAFGLKDLKNFTGDSPFCRCETRGDNKRAGASFETDISSSFEPVWHETHLIDPYVPGDDLEFALFDRKVQRSHKYEASVRLPGDLFHPHGFEGELPLNQKGKETNATLHVQIRVEEGSPSQGEEDLYADDSPSPIREATDQSTDRERFAARQEHPSDVPVLAAGGPRSGGGRSDARGFAEGPPGGAPSHGLLGLPASGSGGSPAARQPRDSAASRGSGRNLDGRFSDAAVDNGFPGEASAPSAPSAPSSPSLRRLGMEAGASSTPTRGYVPGGAGHGATGQGAAPRSGTNFHGSSSPVASVAERQTVGSATSRSVGQNGMQAGPGVHLQGSSRALARPVPETSRYIQDVLAKGRVIGERHISREELTSLGNLVEGQPLPSVREPSRALAIPPTMRAPVAIVGAHEPYRARPAESPGLPSRHLISAAAPVPSMTARRPLTYR